LVIVITCRGDFIVVRGAQAEAELEIVADMQMIPTSPTRVLYLITELETGGAQTALAGLVLNLDRSRFQPLAVCLYGAEATAQQLLAGGVPVRNLNMRNKADVGAVIQLWRLLRRERPVILHAFLFHANLLARVVGRLSGVPIIVTSERTMGMESRARYVVNRLTAPLADRVTAVSPAVRDFVVQHVGIPASKVLVIPNGVDVARFTDVRPVARAAWGLPSAGPLIGAVMRLEPVKGGETLVRAMAALRMAGAHAVVVGDGPQREAWESLADALGVGERTHFVGYQANVPAWLAACDVFVLPSDWEGMPNAALEAMAAGRPAVATAVGGTPDVVLDGVTGLLVPPRDPAALAQAIQSLLDDPVRARAMGVAGRQRVEQYFSLAAVVAQTVALYDSLLQSGPHHVTEGK
jgi:glycosyltransferase involved in cell wall biosynthesis